MKNLCPNSKVRKKINGYDLVKFMTTGRINIQGHDLAKYDICMGRKLLKINHDVNRSSLLE